MTPEEKIGSENARAGTVNAFTEQPTQNPSVSTLQQINNNRGITRQREIQRYNLISTPANEDTELGLEKFELLKFPLDIRKFYMSLQFFQYQRPTPVLNAVLPATSAICLPLPQNLRDDFSLNFYPYDGGVVSSTLQSVKEMVRPFVDTDVLGRIPDDMGSSLAPGFRGLFEFAKQTQIGGGELASQIAQIGAQFLKASFNPLKSVIFDSPNLKTYTFSWTFSPRNKAESEELRKIIKKIKISVLPRYSLTANPGSGGGYTEYNIFNYPYMAKIFLYPWAAELNDPSNYDTEMFQTKYGFIDNFSIDYAPENNVSFFDDEKNPPSFVQISLSFQEIEIWTANDFGAVGKQVIGDKTQAEADKDSIAAAQAAERAFEGINNPATGGSIIG